MNSLSIRNRTLLGLAIPAAFLLTTANAQEEEIVGTWSCSFEMSEEETTMTGDYERSFDADGTSGLVGEMQIVVPVAGLDATFSIDGTGTWRAEDMTLYETMEEVEVGSASESPSPIEEMLVTQLQTMFSANQEEQSTPISALTATRLELDDGGPHLCDKT